VLGAAQNASNPWQMLTRATRADYNTWLETSTPIWQFTRSIWAQSFATGAGANRVNKLEGPTFFPAAGIGNHSWDAVAAALHNCRSHHLHTVLAQTTHKLGLHTTQDHTPCWQRAVDPSQTVPSTISPSLKTQGCCLSMWWVPAGLAHCRCLLAAASARIATTSLLLRKHQTPAAQQHS
jgi:hypothetical protein